MQIANILMAKKVVLVLTFASEEILVFFVKIICCRWSNSNSSSQKSLKIRQALIHDLILSFFSPGTLYNNLFYIMVLNMKICLEGLSFFTQTVVAAFLVNLVANYGDYPIITVIFYFQWHHFVFPTIFCFVFFFWRLLFFHGKTLNLFYSVGRAIDFLRSYCPNINYFFFKSFFQIKSKYIVNIALFSNRKDMNWKKETFL